MKISEILKLLTQDKKLSDILKTNNIENHRDAIIKQILSFVKSDVNFSDNNPEELFLNLQEKTTNAIDELFIYTDGAVSGNPGIGGIGVAIFDKYGTEVAAENENIGTATNNIAEYKAIILAVKVLDEINATNIKLNFFADSELMVKQIKGEYKIANLELQKLCMEFLVKIKKFKGYSITHVPREKNKAADHLAVLAKSHQIIKRRIK